MVFPPKKYKNPPLEYKYAFKKYKITTKYTSMPLKITKNNFGVIFEFFRRIFGLFRAFFVFFNRPLTKSVPKKFLSKMFRVVFLQFWQKLLELTGKLANNMSFFTKIDKKVFSTKFHMKFLNFFLVSNIHRFTNGLKYSQLQELVEISCRILWKMFFLIDFRGEALIF